MYLLGIGTLIYKSLAYLNTIDNNPSKFSGLFIENYVIINGQEFNK